MDTVQKKIWNFIFNKSFNNSIVVNVSGANRRGRGNRTPTNTNIITNRKIRYSADFLDFYYIDIYDGNPRELGKVK